MCEHGVTTDVLVRVPADLSHTGKTRRVKKPIDSCIADIVDALNNVDIWTRSSCCGHGEADGYIDLDDGRTLVIKRLDEAAEEAANVADADEMREVYGE